MSEVSYPKKCLQVRDFLVLSSGDRRVPRVPQVPNSPLLRSGNLISTEWAVKSMEKMENSLRLGLVLTALSPMRDLIHFITSGTINLRLHRRLIKRSQQIC